MDSIVLTRKQEEGLRIAVERFKHKEPYTCIAGYAGTGKSTLVKHIIAALDVDPAQVCYIAYTGKAAQVLSKKGNPNATTAHKLLYKHIPKGDGTFIRKIVRPLPPYKVIVVDEISMLPMHMWTLLLSHNIYVLALGDPGQLPPIMDKEDDKNDILNHPHIFLDEVMRQAQDSSIIRLTMDIRAQKPLSIYRDQEVRVLPKSEYLANPGMIKWADQIICAKNVTRTDINHTYRRDLMDVDDHTIPILGDKLICLRNVWDNPNIFGECLVNGLTGTLVEINIENKNPFIKPNIIGSFIPDGYEDSEIPEDLISFNHLQFDPKIFATGEKTMKTKADYRRIPDKFRPLEFDYAYAITCHKAQGSEYNKVLVIEEYMKGDNRESHARWLYTAATRAVDKLIIIKP